MEIIDKDDENEEDGNNERHNGVILGKIKRKYNERQNWTTEIKPEKSFFLLFQGKTISFKWRKMIFP